MPKINSQTINSYFSVETKEADLWKESIFVFDTSALLQFYYYSDKAKKNIFETTFETLKGRLWIPHQVGYEYLKNRESTIKKSYSEKYDPLEKENIKGIQNLIESIVPKLDDLQNKTKSTDTHPFIDTSIIEVFKEKLANFRDSYKEFEEKAKQEFEIRKSEINSMLENDIVFRAIENYFEEGEAYSFEKTMEIVSTGEIRYRNSIPPGYRDGNDKEGIQKYGDLIIWQQVIDYAHTNKKPIIFITNDVKDDWVYTVKHDKEKRIDRPREELIKEIKDHANVSFWMYTFSQFLYKAKEKLNTQIESTVLEEVKQIGLIKKDATLSLREMEILRYVARGLSNKEIAIALRISHQTVKNHVTSILRKLGVLDRTQAVLYALQNRWIFLEELDIEEGNGEEEEEEEEEE